MKYILHIFFPCSLLSDSNLYKNLLTIEELLLVMEVIFRFHLIFNDNFIHCIALNNEFYHFSPNETTDGLGFGHFGYLFLELLKVYRNRTHIPEDTLNLINEVAKNITQSLESDNFEKKYLGKLITKNKNKYYLRLFKGIRGRIRFKYLCL